MDCCTTEKAACEVVEKIKKVETDPTSFDLSVEKAVFAIKKLPLNGKYAKELFVKVLAQEKNIQDLRTLRLVHETANELGLGDRCCRNFRVVYPTDVEERNPTKEKAENDSKQSDELTRRFREGAEEEINEQLALVEDNWSPPVQFQKNILKLDKNYIDLSEISENLRPKTENIAVTLWVNE